jgi:hypothetical protein
MSRAACAADGLSDPAAMLVVVIEQGKSVVQAYRFALDPTPATRQRPSQL